MLTKLIVSSYEMFIEIALWLLFVGAFIGGWTANGFLTGVGALIGAFIFAVLFGGAFIILNDIRKKVTLIEGKVGNN